MHAWTVCRVPERGTDLLCFGHPRRTQWPNAQNKQLLITGYQQVVSVHFPASLGVFQRLLFRVFGVNRNDADNRWKGQRDTPADAILRH